MGPRHLDARQAGVPAAKWRGARRLLVAAAVVLAGALQPAGAQSQEGDQETTPPGAQEPVEIPTVVGIQIIGAQRYRREEIEAALGQRIGEPLDPRIVDEGVRNLWESLKVRATIQFRERPGGVELRVDVVEMPFDLEPRFIGNVEFNTEKLLEWALISGREELFLFQARTVRRRILENYRREGYYWAEVAIVSRGEIVDGDEPVAPDVIFEIKEGPRVRVDEVIVLGNESLPDKGSFWWAEGLSKWSSPTLKGPRWLSLRFRGSPFVDEELQADLQAMRTTYRDRGWLEAVVDVEELKFNRQRDKVTIVIRIDEGMPYKVSSLDVKAIGLERGEEGLEIVPGELLYPKRRLLNLCRLTPGTQWAQQRVQSDHRSLRSYYGERGYLDHPSLNDEVKWRFLEPELVFNVENHTVAVTYVLHQGRQIDLREVRISGTRHTRDRVPRSRVSVFPGERANLSEIERSLRRIRSTGFFSDSFRPLDHPEPTYRFLPVEGDPTVVDLEFVVEEGRVVDANIAGGVDSNDGLFGILSLTMRNFDITDLPSSFGSMFREVYDKEAFHGAGQRLDIEVSPGTELTRLRLRYFYPDIFNTDLKPVGLDIDLNRRVRIFEEYDEDRFVSRLRLSRRYESDVILSGGLEYRSVDVSNLDDPVPGLLTFQEQQGRIDFVGPTLEVRQRNVDDVLIPHEGNSWRTGTTLFAEEFGGDISMWVLDGSYDWYTPTYVRDDGVRHVFHAEIDAGVQYPFSDTPFVPYSERYQLGGRSTLRGFDFRGVGPVDPVSGYPVGGQTFIAGSFEYYVPLSTAPGPDGFTRQESLRGGVFLDYGVLGPESFEIDLDEVRVSAGFSVGLVFPFPIQLNFGWPLVFDDDDELEVLSFSFNFN